MHHGRLVIMGTKKSRLLLNSKVFFEVLHTNNLWVRGDPKHVRYARGVKTSIQKHVALRTKGFPKSNARCRKRGSVIWTV